MDKEVKIRKQKTYKEGQVFNFFFKDDRLNLEGEILTGEKDEDCYMDEEDGYRSESSDEVIGKFTESDKESVLGNQNIPDSFAQQAQVIFNSIVSKSIKYDNDPKAFEDTRYDNLLIRKFTDTKNGICFYLKDFKTDYATPEAKMKFDSIDKKMKDNQINNYYCCVKIFRDKHTFLAVFDVSGEDLRSINLFNTYPLQKSEKLAINKICTTLLNKEYIEPKMIYPFFKDDKGLIKSVGSCSTTAIATIRQIDKISRREGFDGLDKFFSEPSKDIEFEKSKNHIFSNENYKNIYNCGYKLLPFSINEMMIWYLIKNKGCAFDNNASYIRKEDIEPQLNIKLNIKNLIQKVKNNFSVFARDFTIYPIR